MNIFVVNENPLLAAMDLCDQHCVKMPTETAQLLCSVFENSHSVPYKTSKGQYNHPAAKWARESYENYLWLYAHGIALCFEFKLRYKKQEHHKAFSIIAWCKNNINKLNFPQRNFTPHVLCMPEQYKSENPIESYRKFYVGDKLKFATWKYSARPAWINQNV